MKPVFSRVQHCAVIGAVLIFGAAADGAAQDRRTFVFLQDWYIDGGASATFIKLPRTEFTLVEDNGFNTLSKHTNHDGHAVGPGFDLGIERRNIPFGNYPVTVRVSGYYAWATSTQTIIGDGTAGSIRVGWADPTGPAFKVGFAGGDDISATTRRRFRIWGGGLTVGPSEPLFGFLFPRVGFSYKAIRQKTNINAFEIPTPTNLMTYEERLNTDYYGGIIGFSTEQIPLGAGFWIGTDVEGGVYNARTRYSGTFSETVIPDSGTLSLSRSRIAFVGAVRLTLWRDFGFFRVGIFGRGEFYSFAPKMVYNDQDPASIGLIQNTAIRSGQAYTASGGIKIVVPLP